MRELLRVAGVTGLVDPVALGWRVARAVGWVWRFQHLRLSEWLHGGRETPVVLQRRFAGALVELDLSRSSTHRLLYLQGERFVAERCLLRSALRPGMVAVDVGANIGYTALLLRRGVGTGGQVVCFEPEPTNLRELRANVAASGYTNVRIVEAAVGNEDGEVHFARGLNGHVVSSQEPHQSVSVPLCRLDSVLHGRVDFLKIDVEGYEGHVLDGAASLIERWRPVLFVEVHPTFLASSYTVRDVMRALTSRYSDVRCYAPVRMGSAASRVQPWRELWYRYLNTAPVQSISKDPLSLMDRASLGSHATFWAVARG